MDVMTAIRERRSVRKYEEREIPKEVVDRLAEAALSAPSSGNLQSRKFFFITRREPKTQLARAALDQWFIAEAPLAIVACADTHIARSYGQRGRELYAVQDATASVENILIAAVGLGLGACWVGAFRENQVAEGLDLPIHLRPVAIVAVGYPAENPPVPPKVKLEDAIEFVE